MLSTTRPRQLPGAFFWHSVAQQVYIYTCLINVDDEQKMSKKSLIQLIKTAKQVWL